MESDEIIDEVVRIGVSKSQEINQNQNITRNKENSGWVGDGRTAQITIKPNMKELDSGLYTIKNSMNGLYLERQVTTIDGIIKTKESTLNTVLNDLNKFWSKETKKKYDEYNIIYKRGILMYGAPGTGKTVLINSLIENLINKKKGICLVVDDMNMFAEMAKHIRTMEPNKPILAILEDFDGVCSYNSPKTILNVLDGNQQIENVVYLATTNHIDRIPENMLRPSRFDVLVEVGLPNAETRRVFIKARLSTSDLKKTDIKKLVNVSDGLSMAGIKEMIISVFVFDKDLDETVEQLKMRR